MEVDGRDEEEGDEYDDEDEKEEILDMNEEDTWTAPLPKL